ncbi:acyltransferase family protein [Arthrobacter yangruifuii]|uniref:Acyltransferase family protein n=1 Tax=Arthrobacter yangruifuii TaxID=2606616 RepID=A0A5N6MTT5_9MICC|nr:acyltransferase family protein [Arthrobacter yangruifuii]KAD4060544.1 acyltransferase family protein [Arthrobacter yangruifuii]
MPTVSTGAAPDAEAIAGIPGSPDLAGHPRTAGRGRHALRSSPRGSTGTRRDIQGLRALAVVLVMIYHIWPDALPGGFVGVDVFFVISGYLIVWSLVRELHATSTIALASFYARRIRRLLPAAATVLLATLAATVLLFPEARWQGVARDVAASSLNVQNWNQAFSTTSYAGATAAVSPLQHYWSLAVEEQFYLVVPVLLLAAAAAARALKIRAGMSAVGLAVICGVSAVSFIHSVQFSTSDPGLAYFFTTTRIWELGLGGILALTAAGGALPRRLSTVFGWAGMVLVFAAAFGFSTAMSFPGWVALVPTAGAALCLLAGQGGRSAAPWISAGWWQSLRPVVYAGDISYSLYLWHWPVTVFTVYFLGRTPGLAAGAAIAAASVLLAVLSTRFIEKPFRRARGKTGSAGRPGAGKVTDRAAYALAAVLIAVPVAAAAVPYGLVQQKITGLTAEYDSGPYPGAMAFDSQNPAAVPEDQALRPAPEAAAADMPVFDDACKVYEPAKTSYEDCVFGDADGARAVVLVGDSHAAQYMTPLDEVAREEGYRLYVLTRNGCPFSAEPLHSKSLTYTACAAQNLETVQDILEIEPELVVTSAMRPDSYEDALGWSWDSGSRAVDGYQKVLEPLEEAGIRVGVIADLPYPGFSIPDCLNTEDNADDCFVPRSGLAVQDDPLMDAAELLDNSVSVDLTDYFCEEERCPGVVGNVVVYRDNHMTDTFARTLVQPLRTGLGL